MRSLLVLFALAACEGEDLPDATVAIVAPADGSQVQIGPPFAIQIESHGCACAVEAAIDGTSVSGGLTVDTTGLTPGQHHLEVRLEYDLSDVASDDVMFEAVP